MTARTISYGTLSWRSSSTEPASFAGGVQGARLSSGRARGAGEGLPGRALSRRTLLWLAAIALPRFAYAGASSAGGSAAELRLCKVRHGTFLVDLAGVRVVIDPCFSRHLVSPWLGASVSPARKVEHLGETRLLLVTSPSGETFSPRHLRSLARSQPRCLVPDERVAKQLRSLGLRRVRRVRAGDVMSVAGLRVSVSPRASGPAGDAVGYHLSARQRSLWFPGDGPPLDVDTGPLAFAGRHPAEVLITRGRAEPGFVGGTGRMGAEDARLLALQVGAAFCIRAYDDVRPAWLGKILAPSRSAIVQPGPERVFEPSIVEPGVWYRVPKRPPRPRAPW